MSGCQAQGDCCSRPNGAQVRTAVYGTRGGVTGRRVTGRGVGLRPGILVSLPSPRQSVVPLSATGAARPELSGTTNEHSFGQLSLHALLDIMRWELMEMILL